MRRFRAFEHIVQRAEYYETDAGRRLRLRAEARVVVETGQTMADGGTVVADSARPNPEKRAYTRHVEPPEQGEKEYIRCRYCERELLVELGGWDKLPHAPNCPERESR